MFISSWLYFILLVTAAQILSITYLCVQILFASMLAFFSLLLYDLDTRLTAVFPPDHGLSLLLPRRLSSYNFIYFTMPMHETLSICSLLLEIWRNTYNNVAVNALQDFVINLAALVIKESIFSYLLLPPPSQYKCSFFFRRLLLPSQPLWETKHSTSRFLVPRKKIVCHPLVSSRSSSRIRLKEKSACHEPSSENPVTRQQEFSTLLTASRVPGWKFTWIWSTGLVC